MFLVQILPGKDIMGGSIVRHEPAIMDAIRQNIEVFRIFEEAGWMTYLERLNGFNGGMAL